MNNKWKYYNHALIPACEPHEEIDIDELNNCPLWSDKRVLFARWTSDFDCGYDTQWWYCIKDTIFDINNLNAKKRYEVNKGKKFFYVKVITSSEYHDEIFRIFEKVLKTYSTDLVADRESYIKSLYDKNLRIFGAFFRENDELCGYAILKDYPHYISYITHKVLPEYEAKAINAAIVNGILDFYKDALLNGNYICDGERNINHQTNFQDYLIKYFGFRRAYCKLNLKYKPHVKFAVAIMYPFKKIICKFQWLNKLSAVLKMHEYYKMSIQGDTRCRN